MSMSDPEEEFADTLGDLVALWVGAIGLVLVASLGLLVIGFGTMA